MKYIDLAVAALIGASALTGLAAWDPRQGDSGSHNAALQAELRDSLLGLLSQKGTVWILQSTPATMCSYFESRSNSTYGLDVTLGSTTCGSPPEPGAVTASISMKLLPFEVTLESWSLARA